MLLQVQKWVFSLMVPATRFYSLIICNFFFFSFYILDLLDLTRLPSSRSICQVKQCHFEGKPDLDLLNLYTHTHTHGHMVLCKVNYIMLMAGNRSTSWHAYCWSCFVVCLPSDFYTSCTSWSAWLCGSSTGKFHSLCYFIIYFILVRKNSPKSKNKNWFGQMMVQRHYCHKESILSIKKFL